MTFTTVLQFLELNLCTDTKSTLLNTSVVVDNIFNEEILLSKHVDFLNGLSM